MNVRPMNENEQILFQILKNNPQARKNNWYAVRMFYWQRYGVKLPDMGNLPAIWTIERSIRTLKEMYRECNDESAEAVKKAQESKYKQQAIEKPMKAEQIEMKWWDEIHG